MNDKLVRLNERIRSLLRPGEYLYHGTDSEAARLIKQSGFNSSELGKLGRGVYTTPDTKYADFYAKSKSKASGSRPALMIGRNPGDWLNFGMSDLGDWQNYPKLEYFKGKEKVFRNPEEANEAFGVGGKRNRAALQSFMKVFNTLKMVQNPVRELGLKLGEKIYKSKGRKGAALMSILGGDAPTYD